MNMERETERGDCNRANKARNEHGGQRENDKTADKTANTDEGDCDED